MSQDSVEDFIRSAYAWFNRAEPDPSGQRELASFPIDMELAHIVTVKDGKIRRLEEYQDRADALEAAGLRE
jgi:hypothetical protein